MSFMYFFRLLKEFKEANIYSMFAIEKAQRNDLLKPGDNDDSVVRHRKKNVDKDGLLKMSSGITYFLKYLRY